MQILAIGNSFSQDAMRYLHEVAKADGVKLTTVNLYIGGCSLYRHFQNIMADNKAYAMEFNGQTTGFEASIKEALLTREWNAVTFQQVSGNSKNYNTFQPYLNELSAYTEKYAPKAKQYLHQTWAYEDESTRLVTEQGFATSADMFKEVENSYNLAKDEINASGLIPSGELMLLMSQKGIKVHRDTFHASFGAARYGLALLWYGYFTGNDVMANKFTNFDVPVTQEEITTVKECVAKVLENHKK